MAAKTWSGVTGGRWATDADWSPAGAPTAADDAVIDWLGSGDLVLIGPGSAASLRLLGAVTLAGTLQGGPLVVAGTLTLGGPSATFRTAGLSLTTGAAVQAGSVVLTASPLLQNQVSVDGTSSLEVGRAADAAPGAVAAGAITIDAGGVLAGAGTITTAAGVINQGVMRAEGGVLTIIGAVRGGGQLQIGAGAEVALYGGATTQPVAFTGAGGTLLVTTVPVFVNNVFSVVLSEQGVITGFVPGDTLIYAGNATLTGTRFTPGANGLGVLSLLAGAGVAGSVTLAGAFVGEHFTLTALGTQGYAIGVAAWASPDPLFDPAYYLAANPDVARAGIDPYRHFITIGWTEGRNPDAWFDTRYVLGQSSGWAASGIDPLLQFEAGGWRQGIDPSARFSTRDYLAANPDVAAAGIDPLLHFVLNGQHEGRTAFRPPSTGYDPGVDPVYYYAHNPDVAAAGVDASAHYDQTGWKEGRNPDAWFDTRYYLQQNPDVAAAGIDPLTHFLTYGWTEGRDPSLLFSGGRYLAANPDVQAAGIDPLLHYMANGKSEGRAVFLSGGALPADPLIDAAYYDPQLGATLLPAGAAAAEQAAWSYHASGWLKGLNPDAWFDTSYYLTHNPDVAAAHVDPLLHYESHGWTEGRDPSAQFSTGKYLAAYADVRAAGVDPLLHFVVSGQAEGRHAFAV